MAFNYSVSGKVNFHLDNMTQYGELQSALNTWVDNNNGHSTLKLVDQNNGENIYTVNLEFTLPVTDVDDGKAKLISFNTAIASLPARSGLTMKIIAHET